MGGNTLIDLLEDFGGFGLMLIGLWVLFTSVRSLAGSALKDLVALLQGRDLGERPIGVLTAAPLFKALNDWASLSLARTGQLIRLGAIATLSLSYALETQGHVPGVMAAVRAVAAEGPLQVALLYLFAQCAIVCVGELAGPRLCGCFRGWSPARCTSSKAEIGSASPVGADSGSSPGGRSIPEATFSSKDAS